MVKRVVVAGSRWYNNYGEAKQFIDECLRQIPKEHTLVFVSGGCRGADLLGERYADEGGFELERYPAEWDKYGRGAGPKRNRDMAQLADYVICFWDTYSRGTRSMIEFAKKANKHIYIKKV